PEFLFIKIPDHLVPTNPKRQPSGIAHDVKTLQACGSRQRDIHLAIGKCLGHVDLDLLERHPLCPVDAQGPGSREGQLRAAQQRVGLLVTMLIDLALGADRALNTVAEADYWPHRYLDALLKGGYFGSSDTSVRIGACELPRSEVVTAGSCPSDDNALAAIAKPLAHVEVCQQHHRHSAFELHEAVHGVFFEGYQRPVYIPLVLPWVTVFVPLEGVVALEGICHVAQLSEPPLVHDTDFVPRRVQLDSSCSVCLVVHQEIDFLWSERLAQSTLLRELCKVARNYDLRTAKWVLRVLRQVPPYVSGRLHDLVQALQVQVLHHADLVDDDHIGAPEAPPRIALLDLRRQPQALDAALVVVWAPPGERPGGFPVDCQRCPAGRGDHLDTLAHVPQPLHHGAQDGRLSTSRRARVEYVPAACGELDDLGLLG
ncbi:hypothetical protein diail_3530, partial [Diaporthe ilicicola]